MQEHTAPSSACLSSLCLHGAHGDTGMQTCLLGEHDGCPLTLQDACEESLSAVQFRHC